VPFRNTQSSKLVLKPRRPLFRPRNVKVSHRTEGSESESSDYSTTHEDLDSDRNSEKDEKENENDEKSDQSHNEEKEVFDTIENDFEPVRKSPRKPIPTQKGLKYYHSRLSKMPDNPKGISIDRNDRQNSFTPYLAPLKASWDDLDDLVVQQPKKKKLKTCHSGGCEDGGLCDPPVNGMPAQLPVWNNPAYEALPRTFHKAKIHLPEAMTDPFNIWKLFFTDKIIEGMRACTNQYATQYISAKPPRKRNSRLRA
jgi:hypothetical protein